MGRKGLVNGVAHAAIDVMRDMGSTNISAIIGPSICGSCYEVSQEIHDGVVALHPTSHAVTDRGTPALNLPAALQESLERAGIVVNNESRCTFESDDLYSYRRDGVTGRQAGIISL